MGLERLLRPRRTAQAGRRLYDGAVAQSRNPALYQGPADGGLGAPDTVEGRFELYTLHVVMLLHRLKNSGPQGADVAQALFDAYLQGLDDALRELGVGDLSVGKKMRKLGEAFYGRAKSSDAAFSALPEQEQLQALLTRTVYADGEVSRAPELATYVVAQRAALAAQPLEALLAGDVTWTTP